MAREAGEAEGRRGGEVDRRGWQAEQACQIRKLGTGVRAQPGRDGRPWIFRQLRADQGRQQHRVVGPRAGQGGISSSSEVGSSRVAPPAEDLAAPLVPRERRALGEQGRTVEPDRVAAPRGRNGQPRADPAGQGGRVAGRDQRRTAAMAGQRDDAAAGPVRRRTSADLVRHASDGTLRPVAGWVSLRQLADGAAQTPLLDAAGQPAGPLVLVDLDAPADPVLLAQASRAAQAAERVLVGVRTGEPPDEQWHDLLAALGLTLTRTGPQDPSRPCVALPDPAAEARSLQSAAADRPQACLALSQVLRASAGLDVRSALNVESFAYSTLLGGAEFQALAGLEPGRPPHPAARPGTSGAHRAG